VLRAIAQEREGRVGVYGAVVEPGTVRVGDEVVIES
jgi:MOSC domain-containing protein YiiM